MRRLTRTLFYGLVVLGVLGGLGPGVIGWLVSRHFDRAVDRLAVPGVLRVVSKRFDRGWFVSTARVVVAPAGPLCALTGCRPVALDSRVDQGPRAWGLGGARPALARIETRIDPAALWPAYDFSPNPPVLRVTTRVLWHRKVGLRLSLARAQLRVMRGQPVASVTSSAVHARSGLSDAGPALGALSLRWPRFSMVFERGGHVAWHGLRIGSSAVSALSGAWARHLTIASLTLDNGHGRATRLEHARATIAPHGLGTSIAVHVGKLVLPGDTRGALVVEATLTGLRPRAWLRLPQRWAALDRGGPAFASSALYRHVLPALFGPGASIRLTRAELTTGDGLIHADATLTAPNPVQPAGSLIGWLSSFELAGRLSLPAPIVRRMVAHTLPANATKAAIDARLAALRARRIIRPSDDGARYTTSLVMHDGRLTINGQARPQWRGLVSGLQFAAGF